VSRDQLLGRARRAVLAVAGTAGLGSRDKRRQADEPTPTGRAATPGLPPRIERERRPGMPPVAGVPPRIDREQPVAGLPPRIERGGGPSLPPRIERDPAPEPQPEPEPEPEDGQRDPVPEPGSEVEQHEPPPEPDAPPEPEPPRPKRRRRTRAATPRVDAPAGGASEPGVAVTDTPQREYQPRHARTAAGAPSQPEPAPAAEVEPGRVAPVRPDPLASPVKNVLRSHQRLAYVLLAVILVVSAGFWVLRVHQRIGEHALEAGITKQQHAPTVQCASLQSNGSAWACAVVYRAESVCLIARVGVLGSWSTAIGQHRCERVPRLAALAPGTITATMVAADIDRREARTDFVCDKLPSHKVRWACERPLETGGQCLVVRVIQWTSWNVLDGGKACAHDPKLQKALKHTSA
jgi:hypothetical protein